MKWTLDALLLMGIVLGYGLGHLFAPDRFATAAGMLSLVFAIRLLGSALGWIRYGR